MLRSDPCTDPEYKNLWGYSDVQDDSRVGHFTSGGPNDGPFRRCTVVDGDNPRGYGERCELTYNNICDGLASPDNWYAPFWIYFPDTHAITEWDCRLPNDFPINAASWQVLAQMKQGAPGDVGLGPQIGLQALRGQLVADVHEDPASQDGVPFAHFDVPLDEWFHVRWDVFYSNDPAKASLQLTINDQASPTIRPRDGTLRTQQTEQSCGEGSRNPYTLHPGDPEPSVLRLGIYHDKNLPGSHADLANIRVSSA